MGNATTPDGGGQVRLIQVDGEPWLSVADLCKAIIQEVEKVGHIDVGIDASDVLDESASSAVVKKHRRKHRRR